MDAPTTEELTPEMVGDFIRRDSSRRQMELRQNILMAAPTNPDSFAEATRLGRTAQVPPDFVADDMDTYRNDMKVDDKTAEKIVSLYPNYEAWLSQPDNAKLAHDDVYNLTSVMDVLRSFPAGAVTSTGQGIQGLGSLSTSTSQVLRQMSEGNNRMMLMNRDAQMLQIYSTIFGMAAQPTGKVIRDVGEAIAPPEERQNTATNISSGVGQVAGQVLMYYLTGGTSATALMAGQGAQQQTDRMDEAGMTDPTMRLAAQTLGAGATALTERVQLGTILKGVPGLNTMMSKMPKALQNKWASRAIDITAAGGAEAAQETIEGFLQDAIEYAAYNPDVEFFKEWEATAGEAGAVGAISRALIMGISGARGGRGGVQEQEAQNVIKEMAAQAKQTVQASNLNTRDPEKMREVLKAGNPEGKTVTMDGTVLQQFYQSGIDPEEFFNLAPSAREQFEQADVAGTDITIPLDEFLHAMASAPDNAYDFMADFMKVDPDVDPALQGWDLSDPDELNAFIQQAVRQAQEEWGAKFEQAADATLDERIERQIRDNLMNTEIMGEKARAPEAAATEATLYGSFSRALLNSGGEAASRVFERRFGTNYQVEGYRPKINRAGTGSAYYDSLRRKVKARAAAEKRGEKKRAEKKGLFGGMGKTRSKATPTPLINALIARGGIERGSKIAAELESIGITTKSHPRLYARGRLGDIDNIVLSELEGELGTTGVFRRDEDLNGYVDRQELLDRLRDESHGEYIRSDVEMEKQMMDEQEQVVLDTLSEAGVDIQTASVEEIEAAIDASLNRQREEYETMQNASFYQTERGVTQFTDTGKTIVKLFEGADESTFLHETGHVFLDIFADIARQPDAPQAIKDDWQRTLDWLGVKDASEIQTAQHEQFARGFEAYLYQGDAPSVALRGTFDRFKIWLANIYRTIKQLNVNVSPEMKEVFDRLLATNDEIDAIRNNPVVAIEAKTLEMLSPAQQERYLKAKAEAIRNAKDKLFRKAIRQARRKNTEWWNEESNRVQAEVEKELRQQPVYRATQFVQTGRDFDGQSLMVNDDGATVEPEASQHKLNEAAVVEAFDYGNRLNPLGRDELKYLPRGIRIKEGGLDPKLVAEMFGFKSAVDMLRSMQQADPYAAAVQKMTEDRMIAKHGDMLNDGTIEAEALAMVMQEDTKAAQVELQALSEMTGAAYPSDGDFARAAEIAIGSLTVDQAVKPERYYRAALKASREYGKALQAKQYEDRVVTTKDGTSVVKGAASWKRQEILNKHLHRLSKKAREETEKAVDRFKKLEKMPPKGDAKKVKIDPDYHQKIWDILDKYNLAPKLSDAKRLKIELAAINQWMQAQEQNEDAQLMMPPELLAADNKTHYRDMTLNEFRGLRDLVTNLETQGRNKRKFIMQNAQRDLEELTSEMVATAEQNNAPRIVSLSERRTNRGVVKGIGKIVNGIDAVNTKTSQMMVLLDGGDNYGIWTQTVYEPVQRAEVEKNIRNRAENKRFRELFQKHYGDEPNGFMEQQVQAGAEPITVENMLSVALHQGTEDNRQKLIDGYAESRGWDEDFIDRILSNMRKKDWDFVIDAWKYLDSFWAETSAVEKRRFGYAPEKIEGRTFTVTTADGVEMEIEGGYMRIMYDSDQSVMAGNNEAAQTFKELSIGKNARAATRRGAMIERVSGVKEPIRLDLDVLTEHASEQVGIITMAETVENVNKVLRKKEIQETLQAILGRDGKEMIDLWLQDVAVGGQLSTGTINRGLRMLRTNYTVGRLGLRPITALLQWSGLSHTVADLGIKQTFKGVGKMFRRGNPYTLAKEVAEKSVFMQERRFTLNRDIADALGEYTAKANQVQQKTAALMLYPMQKMQELVDTSTWLAAYDKATGDGLNDGDAIRAADIAVARLQSSGLTSDLAAIERGTVHKTAQRQEAIKAMTMFFSYFNAKYNLLKNKNIQYKNKQISGVDLAMSYVMALLVEGIISSAIMGQIDWDDDDDEEVTPAEVLMALGKSTASTGFATIPFVRNMWSATEGMNSQTASDKQLENLSAAMKTGWNLTVGIGEKLVTGESERLEKMNPYRVTRQAIDAMSVFTPMPASTINQFVRGLEREDKTGEATAMDYLIYREGRF